MNRLVYELFIGGPLNFKENALVVAHKDGDNCNNRHDNLVLMNGTLLYRHGLEINRRPRSGANIKKGERLVWSDQNSPRPIVQYALSGKKLKEFESVEQAAKAMGTFRISIRNVAQKKLMQLHGFVYRYKDDSYKGEYADFSWEKPITQYSLDGKRSLFIQALKKPLFKRASMLPPSANALCENPGSPADLYGAMRMIPTGVSTRAK